MKEIWRNLDGPPENKELWSYVVKFEFSRPKGSISWFITFTFKPYAPVSDTVIGHARFVPARRACVSET